MTRKILLAGLCAAALLGGCGGGSSGTAPAPPPTTQVPPSASQSVDGFIAYLMALVASPADTLEPVSLDGVTPPTSETTEPAPLN